MLKGYFRVCYPTNSTYHIGFAFLNAHVSLLQVFCLIEQLYHLGPFLSMFGIISNLGSNILNAFSFLVHRTFCCISTFANRQITAFYLCFACSILQNILPLNL